MSTPLCRRQIISEKCWQIHKVPLKEMSSVVVVLFLQVARGTTLDADEEREPVEGWEMLALSVTTASEQVSTKVLWLLQHDYHPPVSLELSSISWWLQNENGQKRGRYLRCKRCSVQLKRSQVSAASVRVDYADDCCCLLWLHLLKYEPWLERELCNGWPLWWKSLSVLPNRVCLLAEMMTAIVVVVVVVM